MYEQLELPLKTMFWEDNNGHPWEQGYAAGVEWECGWLPGGPLVYDKISRLANDEYRKGFLAGLEGNFERNPDFADWWKSNNYNVTYKHLRYHKDLAYT